MIWQGKVELAPAYDFLSTTVAFLALGNSINEIEEIALPLQGKKRGLGRNTWIEYFARERLKLPDKVIDNVGAELANAAPAWRARIADSLLQLHQKDHYQSLLDERSAGLKL